jgi:hypothetical protein
MQPRLFLSFSLFGVAGQKELTQTTWAFHAVEGIIILSETVSPSK